MNAKISPTADLPILTVEQIDADPHAVFRSCRTRISRKPRPAPRDSHRRSAGYCLGAAAKADRPTSATSPPLESFEVIAL